MKHLYFSALVLLSLSVAGQAQETTTYTYDALGRVTNVDQSGGRNNDTHANYQYDAAGNRQRVVVTCPAGAVPGTPNACAGYQQASAAFVVVPLNGYTLIPTR